MPVRIFCVALAHYDKNLAPLVGRAGDEPFMPIEDPFIAISADVQLDIGRVT